MASERALRQVFLDGHGGDGGARPLASPPQQSYQDQRQQGQWQAHEQTVACECTVSATSQ
jgi:hypothetical protein